MNSDQEQANQDGIKRKGLLDLVDPNAIISIPDIRAHFVTRSILRKTIGADELDDDYGL